MNETPKNIFLLAGQSNMVGHKTQVSDIPRNILRLASNAQIWTERNGWRPLRPNAGYQRQAGYGPEFALAATLVNKGVKNIGFVKVSGANSSIETEWNPNTTGILFEKLIQRSKSALSAEAGILRGIFWFQGCSDALKEENAKNYGKNLENFVDTLRACLGHGKLPVISAIVSPPETYKYREIVRTALRKPKLDNYSSLETDKFNSNPPKLHFDGNALHRIGRQFALSYLQNFNNSEKVMSSTQKWVWRGDNLEAWIDIPTGSNPSKGMVLAFPFAGVGNGLKEAAFGREVFSKKQVPAIYIRNNVSRWFQSEETFEMCAAIRKAIGEDVPLLAYGASMGAYGALLMSKALNIAEIIAVAPQYSINRKEVPWETRWSKAIPKIGTFVYSMNDHLSENTKVTVIYDSKSSDQRQVELFNMNENWNLVKLPYATHQILRFISETGKISLIPKDFPSKGPDAKQLRSEIRANKGNSYLYLDTLATALVQKRPELAIKILQSAVNVKGAKPRRVREKIQIWQEKFNIQPN